MQSFADFPPEIIGGILEHVDACFGLIPLWLCGSKILNHKIAHGGCHEVYLMDERQKPRAKWPVMLSELRSLRKLTISRTQGKWASLDAVRLGLMTLPCDLEELVVNFNVPDASVVLPVTGSDPSAHRDSIGQNIAKFFHKLRLLEAEEGFVDVSHLPDTLEEILITSTNNTTNPFTEELVKQLPRGLKSLDMESSAWLPDALCALPPSLTYFHGSYFRGWPLIIKDFPRTLTELLGMDDGIEWTPDIAFPPALTKLNIACVSLPSIASWAPALPHLTRLKISPAADTIALDGTMLKSLPRTLRRLTFASKVDWTSLREKDYPRDLTSLKCHERAELRASTLNQLPKSEGLKKLILNIVGEEGDPVIPAWNMPPALEVLIVHNVGSDAAPRPAKALPPTLTHLQVPLPSDPLPLLTFLLPSNITTLTLAIRNWLKEGDEFPLPKRLLHLVLTDAKTLQSADTLACLPRSLLTLRVVKSGFGSFTKEHVRALPPSLTVLEILPPRIDDWYPLEAGSAAAFPRSLKTLSLPKAVFDLSDLEFFPPNLETLSISVITLEKEDLRAFQRLESLSTLRIAQTGEDTHAIPFRDCLPYLPPSIGPKVNVNGDALRDRRFYDSDTSADSM